VDPISKKVNITRTVEVAGPGLVLYQTNSLALIIPQWSPPDQRSPGVTSQLFAFPIHHHEELNCMDELRSPPQRN
jgi:hypothetical protein